jgi:hypothetical protein
VPQCGTVGFGCALAGKTGRDQRPIITIVYVRGLFSGPQFT